jgi:hypothetical protein
MQDGDIAADKGKPMMRIAAVIILAIGLSADARYALLVGSNQGGGSLQDLRFAESDARHFQEVLIALGDFTPDRVVTLCHPDSAALARALARMDDAMRADASAGRDGLLFFYYSGHADESRLLLGGSQGFPLNALQAYLDTSKIAVRIGIFDACRSGAVTAMKGGTRAEPFYLANRQRARGEVIIASSAVNEESQESELLRGSVFSHHFLNALRGSGDASGDRMITLNEAYQYAYRKTLETTALTGGGVQHPVYRFNIAGQGDIVLTNLAQDKSGVVLDKMCSGSFLVFSDDYTDVFADFSKKQGTEFFVSLPGGRYTVINAVGRDVRTSTFSVSDGSTSRLASDSLTTVPLALNRIKGEHQAAFETAEDPPLSTFTGGIGLGAFGLWKQTPREIGRGLSLSLGGSIFIRDNLDFFFDGAWLLAGPDGGIDAGVDYRFSSGRVVPVIGAGAAFYYFGREGGDFIDRAGAGFTAHGGLILKVNDRVRVAFRLPFTTIFNRAQESFAGAELRLLIAGPYEKVKVQDE